MKQPSQDMLYHGGEDYFGDLDQQNVMPLQLPKSLSQNNYLRQWVPRTKEYLNILLEREAPARRSCIICGTNGVYKCHGCFGGFFEESCLVKTGLVISLGHNGNPCPCQDYKGDDIYLFADADAEDADDIPGRVDKSGIHTHKIKYYTCADAPTADIQLCQMGLFPASFTQPKTAFTFGVLDDFLLDNLECGMSAMNYYNKLRRMTTSVFPHLVPDHYRELMRVARQWWQLKLLKWNGFGHESKDRKPGDLALFCPACPQPGINVTLPPEDMQEETNSKSELPNPSWLYARSLVMDGNFKAEHLYAANPTDEVSLMDGRAFMVGDATYKAHLAQAKDAVQRSECNNHRAVNQANATRHRLEATGIGGCACARHGCFVPHAMVDFQKGERQMNMDYALCEALKHNASGIRRALTFYDVNCQYHKYLRDRVSSSPFLELDQALEIVPGIGKALCQKFRQAVKGIAESTATFQKLNETADAAKVIEWEEQERLAQQRCTINPKAMDIYEVQLQRVPTRKEQELQLLANGQRPDPACQRGVATWLAEGLSIEEAQLTLQLDLRRLGRHPTESQWLDIARRRERLQGDIDWWLAQGLRFLGDGIGDGDIQVMENELLMLEEDQIDEWMNSDYSSLKRWSCLCHQPWAQQSAPSLVPHIWFHMNWALANLGADDELLERYRPLLKEHLKVSTAVADPNARGQRNNTLAWFWSMDVEGDSRNSDWLNEFYCVHWLRAKALKDRWEEEHLLVQHEMNWTCDFFMHKAEEWIWLGALTEDKVGHLAYAVWQCKMYQCLCQDAMDSFNKARDPANRRAIFAEVE
ncbi:hypothetical protein EV702DRAFT_1041810 [Suillus placidus]|uniref:CxC2-like cysteine cluster KDZ transposase-associated domain-containing protein n=1 Tax=Suillus placidus TaxID=48579 RepID=A0A9P7A429_9AGAM|nr:hypothetical protein EV702DRAFT_1041810 [Suillus placidus]